MAKGSLLWKHSMESRQNELSASALNCQAQAWSPKEQGRKKRSREKQKFVCVKATALG
jgi:hypothetical protein